MTKGYSRTCLTAPGFLYRLKRFTYWSDFSNTLETRDYHDLATPHRDSKSLYMVGQIAYPYTKLCITSLKSAANNKMRVF